MIKILSTNQIKALDAYTIAHEPIASIDLMERACAAFVARFENLFDASNRIGIICGTGNNGGDGLGIARMLIDRGYSVKVWVIKGGSESNDFIINFKRLKEKTLIEEIAVEPSPNFFEACDVLIDAIFGSGLSKPVTGIYESVIKAINAADSKRVAVDIPSGLMADEPSTGTIVNAHYTITFQLPKLAFLLPESFPHTGEWKTVNIGLSKTFIKSQDTSYYLLNRRGVKRFVKPRLKFNHKGDFGHALLVSGSFGKIGAAVLGAKAALRSGVGLLTVQVPGCGYTILQTAVPEAMVTINENEKLITSFPALEKFSAIGVGPGIGQERATVSMLGTLLEKCTQPIVLDADALNNISANRELLALLPKQCILTPHPKEFQRLVGAWKNDFERLARQVEFSVRHHCIVLLKGAYSSISTPDGKVYFNSTGNPGMATGGSGDVLTGIIMGLLAQGYPPVSAAIVGAWVHGLAGDLGARELGEISLTASDIIAYLPRAFKNLQ